jgi:hypothetical protein
LNSPGKLPGRPKLPEALPGGPLDDLDLRVVLVDHERQALGGIGREVDGDRRTAALLDHAILWRRISHESRGHPIGL